MVPNYIEFQEILPKSVSGKIDKKKLKTITGSDEDASKRFQAVQQV